MRSAVALVLFATTLACADAGSGALPKDARIHLVWSGPAADESVADAFAAGLVVALDAAPTDGSDVVLGTLPEPPALAVLPQGSGDDAPRAATASLLLASDAQLARLGESDAGAIGTVGMGRAHVVFVPDGEDVDALSSAYDAELTHGFNQVATPGARDGACAVGCDGGEAVPLKTPVRFDLLHL